MTVYIPSSSQISFLDFPWSTSTRKVFGSYPNVPALSWTYDSYSDWDSAFPGIPAENFALIATSSIAVGAGSHQFCTSSDDGSWLYVDSVLVVANSGLHAHLTVCQTISLVEGLHTISVNFFESGGVQFLQVSMDGSVIAPLKGNTPAQSRPRP